MMWKEYLSNISKECTFKAPATEIELLLIEKELNINLPQKLIDFYHETNGVEGQFSIPYIWSTKQMVRENLLVRNIEELESYRKPDHLLFFSDAGNGDFFGYLFVHGKVQSEDIYVWNHEDSSQRVIASSLEDFLEGWISGKISV